MSANHAQRPAAIVTPVYNGAAFLAECMACVQAQTYANLVHVVLDNGSSDGTAEIIAHYAHGARVPVIAARNDTTIPPTPNWNKALSLMPAETEYFRVLPADDLISPDFVERMAAAFERDPDIGIVGARERQGSVLEKYEWPPGEVFDGRELVAATFLGTALTGATHCMFRRRFYDQRAPDFYDATVTTGDDVDVMLAVMSQSKAGYVREPVAFTRIHAESISAQAHRRKRLDMAEWRVFLHRYGRAGLGERAAEIERTFRRYYVRKLLRWGLVDRNMALFREHVRMLEGANAKLTWLDFADAIADWPLKNLGLRPLWSMFPY